MVHGSGERSPLESKRAIISALSENRNSSAPSNKIAALPAKTLTGAATAAAAAQTIARHKQMTSSAEAVSGRRTQLIESPWASKHNIEAGTRERRALLASCKDNRGSESSGGDRSSSSGSGGIVGRKDTAAVIAAASSDVRRGGDSVSEFRKRILKSARGWKSNTNSSYSSKNSGSSSGSRASNNSTDTTSTTTTTNNNNRSHIISLNDPRSNRGRRPIEDRSPIRRTAGVRTPVVRELANSPDPRVSRVPVTAATVAATTISTEPTKRTMAFQPPPDVKGRKILEDLQQKKQFLLIKNPPQQQSAPVETPLSQSQRTALAHAQQTSPGFFVTQESSFGNLILPVLPRFPPGPPAATSSGTTNNS